MSDSITPDVSEELLFARKMVMKALECIDDPFEIMRIATNLRSSKVVGHETAIIDDDDEVIEHPAGLPPPQRKRRVVKGYVKNLWRPLVDKMLAEKRMTVVEIHKALLDANAPGLLRGEALQLKQISTLLQKGSLKYRRWDDGTWSLIRKLQ